jgi:hypothetical protein
MNRVIYHCSSTGCPLSSLLPTNQSKWADIIEDIIESPPVLAMKAKWRVQALEDEEWLVISLDATVKCCMSTLGQGNYRDPKHVRAEQDVPEEEAIYRVLTVKGKRGGVLFLDPIISESADQVVGAIKNYATADELAMIKHVSTDAPCPFFEKACFESFSSCESISLDPTHIVMKYESCQWEKSTYGSRCLRSIISRFNIFNSDISATQLGPSYTSNTPVRASEHEKELRKLIYDGSMDVTSAKTFLEDKSLLMCW